MIDFSVPATEIFQILRSYDYEVALYDDDGNQVYEPDEARRFFAAPANLFVSLVDDGEDSSIRLHVSDSVVIETILGLIMTLRTCATKYNVMFNMRKYGHELSPKDFSTRAAVAESVEETMDIFEGMYGTSRSSYLKLENARMIVRHKNRVDETRTGARSRNIDRIFIENATGERMLFPVNAMPPARAMVQHVNMGGSFADTVGQQILRMASDYSDLARCAQHVLCNAGALHESALGLREACRNKMREMRRTFERVSRPTTYTGECERLTTETTLNETESEGIAEQVNHLRSALTVEGVELTEDMLKSIVRQVPEDARAKIEKPAPRMVKVFGREIEQGVWDAFKKGQIDLVSKPDIGSPTYTDKIGEMSHKLGAVVPQVRNLELANLLGSVVDRLEHEANPAMLKKLRKLAVHAINGAGLSMNDGLSPNHEVVREVGDWFDRYSPDRILCDEPVGEDSPFVMDPTDGAQDDRIDHALDRAIEEFDIDDFLASEWGQEFDYNHAVELDQEDKVYERDYLMASLEGYLSHWVSLHDGLEDVAASDAARALWPTVEQKLGDAGYTVEAAELSREDVLLPTNPGDDLGDEVLAQPRDPYTDEPMGSNAYLDRLVTLAGIRR